MFSADGLEREFNEALKSILLRSSALIYFSLISFYHRRVDCCAIFACIRIDNALPCICMIFTI